jgi:hypothetical protein
MFYKREEYIEDTGSNEKFAIKHIEVWTPNDNSKKKFIGQLTMGIQTPMGVQQIPLSFEIEAPTIEEAFKNFEKFAEPQIEEARKGIEEEIRRLRQEASSRIIRPGEVGLGGNIDLKKIK